MRYNVYDLGQQNRGNVVEVTLSGSAANARLLDSSNYQNYRNGSKHRYFGGLIRKSPTHIGIPRAGRWYVVVDMQGLRGTTRSSVRVLPRETLAPLPEYRESPLASMVRSIQRVPPSLGGAEYYDVFISHASEDKDEVARPLADALARSGLKVWYDEFELRIGDSLRRKIDQGLARSSFGIVVLSPSFFAKNWPQYELDGLVTREMSGEQIILPLWHRMTKADVIAQSPSLADKLARSTSEFTIEQIASEIAEVISDTLRD